MNEAPWHAEQKHDESVESKAGSEEDTCRAKKRASALAGFFLENPERLKELLPEPRVPEGGRLACFVTVRGIGVGHGP